MPALPADPDPTNDMQYDSLRALELLKRGTGRQDTRFREGQEEAIRHLVEGRGRQLVVQKTGWGKSFVYFIATRLLREADLGPTLLVSPLLALMRNQIAAAARMGVRAETINSDNQDEWNRVEQAARAGAVDILLISPERLANERFRDQVLANVAERIALLVIDEAHCISDWGHDFRPHYRLIERIVRVLPPNLRLLATTATANARVMADLEAILGPDLQVSRGDLNRPSLALQTIRMPGQAERLAWLAESLPSLSGSGIVYTLTVRDAEMVAAWLLSRGIEVAAYTGETGPNRKALEQALLDNHVKALVATTALGMGFDKPDLAFVIHYQTPGSVVAYYQQVGRAGRALEAARGVLLSGGGGHRDHELLHQKRVSHAERGGTGSRGAGSRRRRTDAPPDRGEGQRQRRADSEDPPTAVPGIAGAHRQAGPVVAVDRGVAERRLLGSGGTAHGAAP